MELNVKIAMLRGFASTEGVSLPYLVAGYIATAMPTMATARELQAEVIRLVAYASLTGQELTIPLVRQRLAGAFESCDGTRTCPACGNTLKAYDEHDVRVLACLNCPWAIANTAAPLSDVLIGQLAKDRQEHARLEREFIAAEKGGS